MHQYYANYREYSWTKNDDIKLVTSLLEKKLLISKIFPKAPPNIYQICMRYAQLINHYGEVDLINRVSEGSAGLYTQWNADDDKVIERLNNEKEEKGKRKYTYTEIAKI